ATEGSGAQNHSRWQKFQALTHRLDLALRFCSLHAPIVSRNDEIQLRIQEDRRMLSRIALLAALALPALEARVIVLKAARMFDGKANAVISPGVVVVEDSRIVELGGSGKLPGWSGAD